MADRGMTRRTFSIWAILGFAALVTAPAYADDARQRLLNSLSPSTGFWGDQVTTVNIPNGRNTTTRERVYRKGTILRIEYDKGRTLFDDGTSAVIYFPRPNTYQKRATSFAPERQAQERRQIMAKRLVVEQLPDGEVAGRPAWVISIKTPNGNSRTFWIDKQMGVQLRLDEERPGGAKLSSTFTAIHFTDPPADKLAFTLPPTATETEAGVGRPLTEAQALQIGKGWGGPRVPRWVPAGYKLRGFYAHNFGQQHGLVAVFDGTARGDTLSVFQGPLMGMSGMAERRGKRLRVLGARRGAAEFMVVGPLPEADLQRVMESIPE
jgi:outer membrane lipoprotein-sorting protein